MRRGKGNVFPITDHVNRIGNLVLLPQTLNEEAKRKGFKEKKSVYEKHSLRIVSEITKCSDWTLSQIDQREAKIIEFAKKAWGDLTND